MAGNVVEVPIVAGIPTVQGLVQAIKPISCGREVDNLLTRDGVGDENGNRVADKHITTLDVVPQEVPDIGLGRASLCNKVAADLDMRPVQYRAIRCSLLDQGDKARHLWVVDLYKLVWVVLVLQHPAPCGWGFYQGLGHVPELDAALIRWHAGWRVDEGSWRVRNLLTTTISAPPFSGGWRGPPSENQYRLAFSVIQSMIACFSSAVMR